ncbi:MAG: TIGR01777 family oxidoreductase [Acidobacteria bacterium]|nr:TIGR01777 family oxidoreductase [Acidobacteriota bacterium]
MARIVVSGASGLVGRALTTALREAGHGVFSLSRKPPAGGGEGGTAVSWDPERGRLDPRELEGFDAVVHLAGAGIADGRWTAARRRAIRESRTRGTDLLCKALAGLSHPPKALLCASAAGFYGNTKPGETVTEASPPGEGFLAEVCRAWEAAAAPASAAGIRTVFLRFGVVLSPAGGMLKRVLPVFRAGLGGPLGNGRQPFPWISLEDGVRVAFHCLDGGSGLEGPVNVVAPGLATNRDFTRALGRALHRPSLIRVPGWVLRLIFGTMAEELLLGGAAVIPGKLTASGFRFRFTNLDAALSTPVVQA